jgi:outer membrane protein insertion porin family
VFTQKYNYNQARQEAILTGQQINLPNTFLNNLQNYTQSSTGFTASVSYQLHHSFKRVGLTYSFDTSSIVAVSDASKILFTDLAFRGISGPNSLEGIITSKILPSFSFSTIDSQISPKGGTSLFLGGEIAGLGGTVRSIRPIVQYKHFIPMQKRRNTIGFNVQGSFLAGYGGVVAPPFERFYLGGENDIRGFDIRSVSPVAFLPDKGTIALQNPDGTTVPKDPANPLRGAYTIPVPVERIVFPGGDASLVTNLEYRFTIAGPVALAPFVDVGMNPVVRGSQLRINPGQLADINNTVFGCPTLDIALNCAGGHSQNPPFSQDLQIVSSTNWIPRMSTGLEVQVFLPIINAPFRVYWAYNPLRLDSVTRGPVPITRDMFPPGAAGDFTFEQASRSLAPQFQLREPRKTFRFSVATTF